MMLEVSSIISTHNRRDLLLNTLAHVHKCGLAPERFDCFVIDNDSTDGTSDAVAAAFPGVLLRRENINRGSCAKNLALPDVRSRLIVFLDDDSYPEPGSIQRMIDHFDRHPALAAASFRVWLRDGSRECSAYRNLFICCGVGLRTAGLRQVGGLPHDF